MRAVSPYFIEQGDVEIVRLLIGAGADLNRQNRQGRTALMLAADSGRLDMVEMLLEAGAVPTILDDGGKAALDWAVDKGHEAVAERLEKAMPAE